MLSADPGQVVSFSFHESDIGATEAAISATYFTTRLELTDPDRPYEFRFDGISMGAVTVSRALFTTGIEVGLADLQHSYYVNFPAAGTLWADHRGRSAEVTPGRGALCQPVGSLHVRTSDNYDCHAVRIERHALENHLESLLGHPVTTPVDADLVLDLEHGPGRCWSRLVVMLAREAGQPDSLLTRPLAAAPLHDAVMSGLLHTATHRWRGELDDVVPSCAPGPVRRAVEAMHAHPEYPFTPAGLAALADIGVRQLHEAFRRETGLTPMSYLRRLRLEQVHDELRHAEPHRATVTEIAHRWGFTHLSRFAGLYQQRYGQRPSDTLRQTATPAARLRTAPRPPGRS